MECFTGKSVAVSEWPVPGDEGFDDDEHEIDGLGICDSIFKFNDEGEFKGVFNYENGAFAERIPAKEGE